MKFENRRESIEFICISFILIHLYKLFSERSRASVLECCGEQVAHSDTEQGDRAPGPPPGAPVHNQCDWRGGHSL